MPTLESTFQYDVFLCHSAKDKAIVRPLAERLRKDGIRVWFDEWVIEPGDSIPVKIEEGLDHSRVLVICMSANAFGSDWANLESGTFRFRDPLNKGRRFLPLRLDKTPIRSSLAQFHYISWLPSKREQGYLRLLEVCGQRPRPVRESAALTKTVYPPLHALPCSAHWAKEWMLDCVEAIQGRYERHGGTTGISTGFSDLDALTDGLHPGQMFIIAARPAMGKTAFAMNIVEHTAVDLKIPSVVFSLEMTSRDLSQRMLCSRARVSLGRVSDGFMSERDFSALASASSQIVESPLLIDDAAGLTLQELGQRLRFYVETLDIKLAVIDHLELLHSGDGLAESSYEARNSAVSAGIRTLVRELNIPIVVLVRINRPPLEQPRKKPRPKLNDVSSVELDADVVALLVRLECYVDTEEESDELRGKAILVLAKNRNGRVDEVPLTFIQEYVRFESRSQE